MSVLLKYSGLALIALAAYFLGRSFEEREGSRVRVLDGFVGLLGHIRKGIASYLEPIPRAMLSFADGERRAACSGGFLSVSGGEVSIVAVSFEFSEDIDVERAKKARERAERAIAEKKDRAAVDAAKIKLARALTRISVGERRK